jgi:hypothetical protein
MRATGAEQFTRARQTMALTQRKTIALADMQDNDGPPMAPHAEVHYVNRTLTINRANLAG